MLIFIYILHRKDVNSSIKTKKDDWTKARTERFTPVRLEEATVTCKTA